MLSAEASSLTSLILQRHGLVCRAIELEIELELARLLHAADCPQQAVLNAAHTATAAAAELALLTPMIDDVSQRIAGSWDGLDRVSPRRS